MGLHTPFSILVIGGIVGIFVFAASSAFTVWFKRNQSASEPQEQSASLSATLLKLALSGAGVLGMVFGMNAARPHTFLEAQGLLVGKDLFTVRSRAGFTAEYPSSDREGVAATEYVEQGAVLVSFRPNFDPKEVAAAARQRDILREQLNLERTRLPPVDAVLQHQMESLERRLDTLDQRRKELIKQRESYLREEAKTSTASNSEYRQIEKQIITVDSESKQTAVNLQTAEAEMRSASELLQRNLISQHERNGRVAAYNVLRSKLDELRDRARLLEQEKAAVRANLSEARQRTREQLVNVERWLAEATAAMQQTAAERDEASKRLQEESAHGNERRSSRIRQLELQMEEVTALLPSPEPPMRIEVTAPWGGYIGYRDLSPATLRPDTGPLIVLYKPAHVWVEFQAPVDMARDLTRDNTRVELSVHGASSTQATFPGHLERKLPLPDGDTATLRVSTAPPPSLVRKLALGEEVQAHVHLSSRGFSLAGMFEKAPAFLGTDRLPLLYGGVSFISIIIPLSFFAVMIIARRHKRPTSKDILGRDSDSTSLAVNQQGYPANQLELCVHSHADEPEVNNLQGREKFVYDFTNGPSENLPENSHVPHREPPLPLKDSTLTELERIVARYDDGKALTHSAIGFKGQLSNNRAAHHAFQTWQALGSYLSRSIINHDVDPELLDALHKRIEQEGVWVTPFIASALSRDIHDDTLLAYTLNLCVKRLSGVQHRAGLEPAIRDLARDLWILQRFFPTHFKRIAPNLQQGFTAALHIVTEEVEAEEEGDSLLAVLRQVLADIGADRVEGRHDRG